jgi:hypothetical protein
VSHQPSRARSLTDRRSDPPCRVHDTQRRDPRQQEISIQKTATLDPADRGANYTLTLQDGALIMESAQGNAYTVDVTVGRGPAQYEGRADSGGASTFQPMRACRPPKGATLVWSGAICGR